MVHLEEEDVQLEEEPDQLASVLFKINLAWNVRFDSNTERFNTGRRVESNF